MTDSMIDPALRAKIELEGQLWFDDATLPAVPHTSEVYAAGMAHAVEFILAEIDRDFGPGYDGTGADALAIVSERILSGSWLKRTGAPW